MKSFFLSDITVVRVNNDVCLLLGGGGFEVMMSSEVVCVVSLAVFACPRWWRVFGSHVRDRCTDPACYYRMPVAIGSGPIEVSVGPM